MSILSDLYDAPLYYVVTYLEVGGEMPQKNTFKKGKSAQPGSMISNIAASSDKTGSSRKHRQ